MWRRDTLAARTPGESRRIPGKKSRHPDGCLHIPDIDLNDLISSNFANIFHRNTEFDLIPSFNVFWELELIIGK